MESIITKILRPFWIDGLNTITGTQKVLLLEAFDTQKEYVFFYPIQTQFFKAKLTNYNLFLSAYAADINRFGCAAIESVNEMHYKEYFSRSHSWKCIKAYYAAYYAAHALLRMHGISCTNFEKENLTFIENVADLWGMQNNVTIEKGYYQCILDSSAKEILCNKIVTTGNKGSHEQLWSVFLKHLENIITDISKSSPTPEAQKALTKLQDLKNILTAYGSNGGNWLSSVRNKISYKHLDGLWYPYKESEKYFNKIEVTLQNWEKIPDFLDLTTNYSKPVLRFVDACIFIVSLYLNSAKDMSALCPKGISFHRQGVLSLVNKINT